MEPAFLREIFEAVGEVEALVVRFATLRMSEVERQNLTGIVENGEHEEADYSLVNDRFHDALRQGTQNPMLSGLLDDLQLRTMPLRRAQFRARSDCIHSSQAEHCSPHT